MNTLLLTKAQKLEIKQVVGQPPNDQGLPKQFWDVPKLGLDMRNRTGRTEPYDICEPNGILTVRLLPQVVIGLRPF